MQQRCIKRMAENCPLNRHTHSLLKTKNENSNSQKLEPPVHTTELSHILQCSRYLLINSFTSFSHLREGGNVQEGNGSMSSTRAIIAVWERWKQDVVLVRSSQMYTTVIQHSIPHGGREIRLCVAHALLMCYLFALVLVSTCASSNEADMNS